MSSNHTAHPIVSPGCCHPLVAIPIKPATSPAASIRIHAFANLLMTMGLPCPQREYALEPSLLRTGFSSNDDSAPLPVQTPLLVIWRLCANYIEFATLKSGRHRFYALALVPELNFATTAPAGRGSARFFQPAPDTFVNSRVAKQIPVVHFVADPLARPGKLQGHCGIGVTA